MSMAQLNNAASLPQSKYRRYRITLAVVAMIFRPFVATTAFRSPRVLPFHQLHRHAVVFPKTKLWRYSSPMLSHHRFSRVRPQMYSSKPNGLDSTEDVDTVKNGPDDNDKDDQEETIATKASTRTSTSKRALKFALKSASNAFSVGGFVLSSFGSLVSDRRQYKRQWRPTLRSLIQYLNETGIDEELRGQFQTSRILDNLIILARVQQQLFTQNNRRFEIVAVDDDNNSARRLPSPVEANRFIRHATAVYGDSMIRAVEAEVEGILDDRISPLVESRIAEYVGLPEKDIVLLDVNYYGASTNHLRHYVAVDHEHKQVVLSIRGTFALSEVFVDVAAFSRPFCDGEAHSEMASMAEKVWGVAGTSIRELLERNDGYELVVTGHSLGAGTACLLNILLHHDQSLLPDGCRVRCFAFAPAPVFFPLDKAPLATAACTSFIHHDDIVPFLSVNSVRHAIYSLAAIGAYTEKCGWRARVRLAMGRAELPQCLLDDVERRVLVERLDEKPGAPLLSIPAQTNVWMSNGIGRDTDGNATVSNTEDGDDLRMLLCDAVRMARLGIILDASMVLDHFPPRYVHAIRDLTGKDGSSWRFDEVASPERRG